MFTNKDITALRKQTGAGIMKCKKALEESNGDIKKAKEYLRKTGMAAAAKRSGKLASEGAIGSYIHLGGKIGVLVEVNSETDFVAKNDEFQQLVKDIAVHISASDPKYIQRSDVPEEVVEEERKILKDQVVNEGKPEEIANKIVEGKLNKFFEKICLLEQPYVKDYDKTVKEVLEDKILVIGEKITVRRFVRYELGEGLEKKQENFAEEVRKQMKQ